MCEFSMGDLICPGTRVGPAEDLEVCFDLLVNSFHFTVRLGVIGSGEGEVIIEELSEFLGEGGCKLGPSIRDNFVVESEAQVDFVEKEGGYPLGGDSFLCGAENYPLCEAMVDHDQQGIEARGSRKVGDQVARDLLEGVRGMGFDQSERGDHGMSVRLVLLARGAALDVLVHELREA